jgi:hypothetical protein
MKIKYAILETGEVQASIQGGRFAGLFGVAQNRYVALKELRDVIERLEDDAKSLIDKEMIEHA